MINNSVFIPVNNKPQSEEIEEPPTSPPEPRRSTRSTRDQSPVRHAKVYTFGTITVMPQTKTGINKLYSFPVA